MKGVVYSHEEWLEIAAALLLRPCNFLLLSPSLSSLQTLSPLDFFPMEIYFLLDPYRQVIAPQALTQKCIQAGGSRHFHREAPCAVSLMSPSRLSGDPPLLHCLTLGSGSHTEQQAGSLPWQQFYPPPVTEFTELCVRDVCMHFNWKKKSKLKKTFEIFILIFR